MRRAFARHTQPAPAATLTLRLAFELVVAFPLVFSGAFLGSFLGSFLGGASCGTPPPAREATTTAGASATARAAPNALASAHTPTGAQAGAQTGGPAAATTPTSRTPAPASKAPERPRRQAQLVYELNGKRFPLPLLRGTVGGQRTLMLVDTGANSHVIAGWLARKARLPMKKLGDIGADHVGRAIATYQVEEPKIVLDGWGPVAAGPVLVADVPAMLEKMGIGAFVSPQHLPDDGDVLVLDLARGELHTSTLDDARAEIAPRGKALATQGVRPCIDDASVIKGLSYVLPALIEGSAATLGLDTGAQRTDVLAPSRIGRGLAPRSVANKEAVYAASGRIVTRTVKGANVRIGEWAMTADVDIVPGKADAACPRDGVVSMDVLRSCVLVLGSKDVMGRCGQ